MARLSVQMRLPTQASLEPIAQFRRQFASAPPGHAWFGVDKDVRRRGGVEWQTCLWILENIIMRQALLLHAQDY
eukprot:7245300-Pyramimonas_sp.AAC.1